MTNFKISKYDAKSIMKSSTLPSGSVAKCLTDVENTGMALNIQRRANNGNPISHQADGLNGYSNSWPKTIGFHQSQPLNMHYPYAQQRYCYDKKFLPRIFDMFCPPSFHDTSNKSCVVFTCTSSDYYSMRM